MGNRRRLLNKSVKKSQGFEAWFFVIVVLLALSLFFVILNKSVSEIKEPLVDGLHNSISNDDVNITKVLNQTENSGLLFDKMIPFLIIGLFSFVMILAGSIMKHPMMIFVGIIILGVLILLAVVYSNVYNNITSTDEFSQTKLDMPIQDKFMQYLPYIVFLMAIGIGIAVVRAKGGGYSGGL